MGVLCLRGWAAIVAVLVFAVGCSGSTPNLPDTSPPDQPDIAPPVELAYQGRTLLAAYEVTCDFATREISAEPLRTALTHFDVLPLLRSPWFCPAKNCIKLQFIEFQPDIGYFTVKATLVNPSNLTGYDVRGIVYDNDQSNHRVLNADDYTKLWAPPGYDSIYPFRAFSKTKPDRSYPPLAAFSEVYEFQFDPVPPKWKFPYAVDCSFPGNCEEPFEITDHMQIGEFFPPHGCIKLSVRVNHHKGPAHVSGVTMDASPLGGDLAEMEYNLDSDAYETVVMSQVSVAPGEHNLLVTASSPGTAIELYDYFDVMVYPAGDPENVSGYVYDYDTSEGIPVARLTTSDGEELFIYDSDFCGYFGQSWAPDGSRVLSLSKPGYHTSHVLTVVGGDDVVLEEYVHPNPADPPPMPEIEMEEPLIDGQAGIAIIVGYMHNLDCYEDQVGVYVHQGEEYLMDVDDVDDSFAQQVILAYGLNEIVVRATNATGTVLSDKIEIEYFPAWDFRITLTWDTDESDIDTHVWEPDLSEHCYYVTDQSAHLELDFDDVDGFGPENVTPYTDEVPVGTYPIAINYYADHDDNEWEDQPTACFVTLRLNPGTPFEEMVIFSEVLTRANYNEEYPVQYDTDAWWRPCDLVVQDTGIVSWQEPDYSFVLYE